LGICHQRGAEDGCEPDGNFKLLERDHLHCTDRLLVLR
jgi:hypothetical protein